MTLQFDSKTNIKSRITLIDGASIFFIVLFHELVGLNRPDSSFLIKYLATFGLVLFTFSSGFKLGFNHSDEINNKSFLSKYFTKRFIRLYKAYIGYTLLAFIPLYCVSYISIHYLNLNYEGFFYFWNNLNINGLLKLIIGDNFISYQLWYLMSLLVITAVCFTILYFFNINTLFYLSLPLILFDVMYWDTLKTCPLIFFKAMVFIPTYILGIFYGYNGLNDNKVSASHLFTIGFITIGLLSIIYPQLSIYKYDIILYGLTLPPFMILFSNILLKNTYIRDPLLVCGNYSFQIYLFHWPLILPVLSRFIISILNVDYFIIPYFITILAIIVCIYSYKVSRKIKLNTLFE